MKLKNKNAISLIVLVITILVLSILATTVIISLSNTNIVDKAQTTVNEFNLKQMEEKVQLENMNMILKNNGQEPNMFELIDELYSNSTITDAQKAEMIANGGELKIGEETLRLDTTTVVRFIGAGAEKVVENSTYNLRFKFAIKDLEGPELEYTEFGFVVFPQDLINTVYPEVSTEEKLKIGAKEKYGLSVANLKATNIISADGEYLTNLRLTNIVDDENNKARVYLARCYVKYEYNGVTGIMYSDVTSASVNSVL